MSMKTPLNRVRYLGSAKEGTSHFIRQRMTGVVLVPLFFFGAWLATRAVGSSREDMIGYFSNPIIAGLAIILLVSIAWHMKLGVQVVIEDYVHSEWRKGLALMVNLFFALLVMALTVISVLKLSFGG